jgi:microsomal epoxide hydrolase
MFSTSAPQNDDRSILSQAEREALDCGAVFRQTGWAYGIEQGTRPNTLGFALSSNPLALLAWFVVSHIIPFNCRLLTLDEF